MCAWSLGKCTYFSPAIGEVRGRLGEDGLLGEDVVFVGYKSKLVCLVKTYSSDLERHDKHQFCIYCTQ